MVRAYLSRSNGWSLDLAKVSIQVKGGYSELRVCANVRLRRLGRLLGHAHDEWNGSNEEADCHFMSPVEK
jgi:hypothetical protein